MQIQCLTPTGQLEFLEIDQPITPAKLRPDLIHQAVVTELANQRAPHGHSKTRGSVRGGGRKPWRQKGTGRARHSSVRSPIWTGGGIAFGPKSNQNFMKALQKTMRQQAFQMAVSAKLIDQAIVLVNAWPTTAQAKPLAQWLRQLPGSSQRQLVLVSAIDQPMLLGLRNLAGVQLALVESVRTADIVAADQILLDQPTFKVLMDRIFSPAVTRTKVAK